MRRGIASIVVGVFAVAGGLLPAVCEGRIGETVAECTARYGEVVGRDAAALKQSDAERLHFRTNFIDVLVEFRDGRAWWMRVVKRGLREAERDAVMAGAQVTWEGPEEIGGRKYWRSDDGKLHAVWVQVESVGSLELLTDACLEARKQLQKRRERLVGTGEGDAVYGPAIGVDEVPASVEGF